MDKTDQLINFTQLLIGDPSKLIMISSVTNLSVLSIYYCNLVKIPDLSNLRSLTFLNLSNNNICCMKDLHILTNLKELYIHSNKISVVPEEFKNFKLKIIQLDNNYISNIDNLSRDISFIMNNNNKINNFNNINQFTELKHLVSCGNKYINVNIKNLTKLKSLTLTHNDLLSLADEYL
jgi:Leucine-rich repeat (LRR) protein